MIINNKYYGIILAIAGAIFFSTKAIFVKLAYEHGATPIEALTLRMVFALPFFIAMGFLNNRKKQNRISGIQWRNIIILGILGYYGASFFDFQGLKYITVGLERLIVFIYPTLVLVISAIIFRKKISAGEGLAVLLAYGGIILVMSGEKFTGDGSETVTGAFLVFLSALSYAFYLVGSGKMIGELGSVRYTAIVMSVSCVSVFVHCLFAGAGFFSLPAEVYFYGLMMGVFSTVVPALFLAESIRSIGSGKTSIIGSVGPVSTIAMGAIILGETITLYHLAGTALVLGGVLTLSFFKEKKQIA